MGTQTVFRDDLSIVLCGEAGQGVQTVEYLLTRFLKQCGYHFFTSKEYMSRVRGGSNATSIRVSSTPVDAYVDRIDIFIPLSAAAYDHVAQRIGGETLMIGDCSSLGATCEHPIVDVPFTTIAKDIGKALYANTVAAGMIAGILGLDRDIIGDFIRSYFSRKSAEIIAANADALSRGYDKGRELVDNGTVAVDIARHEEVTGRIVVRGAEAVGMGAIAGGCDFIASYPMSPATGVLVFLSRKAETFDIVAEQAEDEIAAINMALGASYAGARAMVTTSGGGFALMTEGVSLAGIIETPVVIHLGQRPGPATGLPTRTEQGDLNLALYAGHGEFPRAIFAPGTLEDAFELTRHAFDIADRFQVPVFVLTDQYLMDMFGDIEPLEAGDNPPEKHIVETTRDYLRYAVTDDGVSPRGVPGCGHGFVCVDSDEHTEDGRITESMDVRIEQNDKRLRKGDLLEAAALPPVLVGDAECRTIVVCWGSTFPIVREAVSLLDADDISILYFPQVYPLHPDTASCFDAAAQCVVVENNATGQFANLLAQFAGIDVSEVILKYDGQPFSVEELADTIEEVHTNGDADAGDDNDFDDDDDNGEEE